MDREQTTIRLPTELKDQHQQEADSGKKQHPWYMNPPPKWLRFFGEWGWLFSITISITAIIIAVVAMK